MDFTSRYSHPPKWVKHIIIFCLFLRASGVDVQCGKPGRASIGSYSPQQDSYPVDSVVTYSCEHPRLISKPNRRICQRDGTWSGIIPLCYQQVSVEYLIHSTVAEDRTAAKAIDGDPTTCFSTEWEKGGYLLAKLLTSSKVVAITIVFPFGESINVEVTVKEENSDAVVCRMQNDKTQSKTFYCPENARGIFVNVQDHSLDAHFFEICEITIFVRPDNPCLTPDVPHNGFGNMLVLAGLEKQFTYFCGQGYKLFGEKSSTCQPDRTWTPKAPVCIRVECNSPNAPENGYVSFEDDGRGIPFHGRVDYSCKPGFVFEGSEKRFCIGPNEWSGDEPRCIAKQCGPVPATVANGKLIINSTTVKGVAFLECNEGYRPLSDDRIECLPSWQWSQASLICAPIRCDPNPTIPHGSFRLLANSTFYGSRLQVICDQGYALRNHELRMCESDGKWEDLVDVCIEKSCGSVPEEIPESGMWLHLNDSIDASERAILVLKCHPGYHVVGTPIYVRCLVNGSWSFTSASCMKTPQAVMSTDEWAPNLMLVVAVAAGAGTAICILCLVVSFLGIKKRRHSRTNTTVFHVGMSNPPTYRHTQKGISGSPEEHYYTSTMYEDFPEHTGYQLTKPKPRKPSAGLPLLPLDADPVYAQPFETGSSTPVTDNKFKKGCSGSREDYYAGHHIYAEPIDSRRPPSGSSTVSGCVAETWFRGGTTMKLTRKMSLPDCQQVPKTASNSSIQKINRTIGTNSTASLCLEGPQRRSQECTGPHNSNSVSNGSCGLFAELQGNSIYLRTGDEDTQLRPFSSRFKMTDNDIYLDEYFSSA